MSETYVILDDPEDVVALSGYRLSRRREREQQMCMIVVAVAIVAGAALMIWALIERAYESGTRARTELVEILQVGANE